MDWQTFVPRTRQLARLGALLDEALAGRGQIAFLTGEAGSGKTTLIQEFTRRAQNADSELLVAFGDCNAQTGAGDPYLPFREILAQLAGEVETSVAEGVITRENADRLRAFLRESGDVILDVGADVLGIFVPGASLLARLGGKLLARSRKESTSPLGQKQIFEQYTEIIRRLTQHRPLIVLVDDLHWADAASIDLLFHLARRIEGSRILLIGTYRPADVAVGRGGERHPLEPTLAELKRYYGDAYIEVEESDRHEQRNFVDTLIASRPNQLDDSFRAALLRHTEGHPLFTVELLRSFQEQGILTNDAQGRLVLAGDLEWDTLPSRVEGVIEGRIGRLEEELRDLLTVGSVQGETFVAEVIARVRSADERHVIQRLSRDLDRHHQVVIAQGVDRVGPKRLSSYRFRHNLFQLYIYGSLDEVQRSYLHEDVGRILEEIYGDRSREIAVTLARHFAEAGDDERAARYQVEAGETAEAVYAFAEARLHYAAALDRLARLDASLAVRTSRVDATIKLARVSYLGESPEQNLARLQEVEPLAAQLRVVDGHTEPDLLRHARVQYWMGRYHFLLNAPQQAIGLYRKVLDVAPQLGDPELLALPSSVIGRALVSQGKFEQAVPLLMQALEPLEATGNVLEWIHTLNFLGTALAARGAYAEAVGYVERAMTRAREIQSPTAVSLSFIHTWGTRMHAGDRRGMLETANATVGAAKASGDPVSMYVGLGFLAWSEAHTGRFAEAAESMKRCREVADRLGRRLVIADWFAAADAEITLGLGLAADAAAKAAAAVELARSMGGVFAEARAERAWAGALASTSAPWPHVQAHLEASLAAAESGGALPEMARTHSAWARLAIERGEHVTAREHALAANRILETGVTALDLGDLPARLLAASPVDPPPAR